MKVFAVHVYIPYGEYLYIVTAESAKDAFNLILHETGGEHGTLIECPERINKLFVQFFVEYPTSDPQYQHINEYAIKELPLSSLAESRTIIVSGGYVE